MADIIRTWPANVSARSVAAMFGEMASWETYYFTLGRGKPKQAIDRLWFTYQGRIIGSFKVDRIVVNDGSLPRLRSLSNQESEWQIRPDNYVAICEDSCLRLKQRVFISGLRGWRYFDLASYTKTTESKVRL